MRIKEKLVIKIRMKIIVVTNKNEPIENMEENIMIKSKLVKGFMLGLCLTAITTGTAFAQEVAKSSPGFSSEEMSPELQELYSKQSEIDKILFTDHLKDIEDKGFMVNYTSVVDNNVEIGISPFNDENVKYLHELLGKDSVKIVEFDEAIIYATTVAPDVVTGEQLEKEDLNVDKKGDLDETVSSDDGRVYKGGDEEMNIQIESTEDGSEELMYTTTSADLNGEEVQLVSATDKSAEDDSNKVPAPMVVLAIAGGAALIGGTIIASKKKHVK
jgi:hypothetical protein